MWRVARRAAPESNAFDRKAAGIVAVSAGGAMQTMTSMVMRTSHFRRWSERSGARVQGGEMKVDAVCQEGTGEDDSDVAVSDGASIDWQRARAAGMTPDHRGKNVHEL